MYNDKYEGCLWDNYDNGYCCTISASKNQIEETKENQNCGHYTIK